VQRGSSMPTPPYFTSKLPVGHGILVALRPALIGILRAHPLLSPVHDVAVGGIQACREQCAVMLWIDSGRCTLAALKQLTPPARIAVCTTLGLPASPVAPTAQSASILQHVNNKKAAADNAAPAAGGPLGGGGAAAPAAALPLAAAPPPGAPAGQALLGVAAAAAPALHCAAPDNGARVAAPAGGGSGDVEDHEVQNRPRSRSKWNGSAPVPAGVHGAPSLAEFEGQLARAPEKP
jgi:hypothetical protein